jgi:hypothetical protein
MESNFENNLKNLKKDKKLPRINLSNGDSSEIESSKSLYQ